MKEEQTVVISASVTVSVTYCEADFETKKEWVDFSTTLRSAEAKELLIDNLDVDDIQDNIAQLDKVEIILTT